ncbi:hypothetical protein NX059_001123 [Plenodomus lindquistii]|nr:hypothetical protein NX059_001123 [Plenodomus lindquistii]
MPPLPWRLPKRLPKRAAPGPDDAPSVPRLVLGNLFIAAKIALFYHVVVTYIGGVARTEGISMMPTIPHSYRGTPWVLYSSLHRRGRNLKVGDVVMYTHPMFPHQSGLKRIIGMPGDFVSVITPGRGEADFEAVDVDEKWARVREQVIRVPEGHCWVAGDNLEWSRDSRLFGPLPLGLVKGKALAVILPFRERKWLGHKVDITYPKEGERGIIMRR